MEISKHTIERVCRMFGTLRDLSAEGVEYVSSRKLASLLGSTDYTVRKDISLLKLGGYSRKGYEVETLKLELSKQLNLGERQKACIIGLGRLGTALLDYGKFQDDGFEIIAGFDSNINKIERIRAEIAVYSIGRLEEVVKGRDIELGILAVPANAAQETADRLVATGIKGILNFTATQVKLPDGIVYLDMDFTNALRVLAVQLNFIKQVNK